MRESLDVLMVNWNSGQQLRQCLESLREARSLEFILRRIVIVDNASVDHSPDDLPIDLPIQVIRNAENRGFAAAVNQAAAGSTADLLLLLNPDTLLRQDSLTVPLAFLRDPAHANVAVVGIRLDGADGQPQRSCASLPTTLMLTVRALGLHRLSPRFDYGLTGWDHTDSRPVDHVIGAFYLVRRPVFEALGGLDERFFVYLEDLDFSARVAATGYACWYLGTATAFHKGGGASESIKARRLAYALQSRILYAEKHFSCGGAWAVGATTLYVEPFVRALAALAHGSFRELGEVVEGYRILGERLLQTRCPLPQCGSNSINGSGREG